MGSDFRLGEPDYGGQLPESKLVSMPELLGQSDPVGPSQPARIAGPEHLLASISAKDPGLLVLEVDAPMLRHPGQHHLFRCLGLDKNTRSRLCEP